VPLMR